MILKDTAAVAAAEAQMQMQARFNDSNTNGDGGVASEFGAATLVNFRIPRENSGFIRKSGGRIVGSTEP